MSNIKEEVLDFMEDLEYGYIKIKLDELIEEKGISKNKLAHRAEMQRTQLNQYCNNQVTRLDTYVLARICNALDCKIEDLLEFVPAGKEETDKAEADKKEADKE